MERRMFLLFSLLLFMSIDSELFALGNSMQTKESSFYSLSSDTITKSYYLLVWKVDGTKDIYPFDETPVITYDSGTLSVKTLVGNVSYQEEEVHKFTLVEEEVVEDGEPTTEEGYYLYVWLAEGRKDIYAFSEHPVIQYSDGVLLLSTNSLQMEYELEDVWKFTLADMEDGGEEGEPTGIDENKVTPTQFKRVGDVIYFENCTPGSLIQVYSIRGMLYDTCRVDADGNAQLSLERYSEGIYIVKSETITYKLIKR